jgi:WhiB family transcriptional regulator, redox-sensing transcriptional regulator
MSSVVVQFPGTRIDPDAEPLCAAHEPDWWFEPAMFDQAVEICRRCSMRSGCLDRALQSGERLGVWGGLTPEQRAALPNAVVLPLRPGPRSGR